MEHAVERAVIACRGSVIRVGDIVLESRSVDSGSAEEPLTLEELERQYIQEVLARTGGVIKGEHGAAAILGVPGSTLRYRMKKLGIERP